MATFETPRWVEVLGSRLLLRQYEPLAGLEPRLSDDQAVDLALKIAADLHSTLELDEDDD